MIKCFLDSHARSSFRINTYVSSYNWEFSRRYFYSSYYHCVIQSEYTISII